MSVAVLSLKVKSMLYVDRIQNTPNYFILEDSRPCQRLANGDLSFSITCGLNESFGIATRYVANNNIALPLQTPECTYKQQFERSKGMQRAASVYYRINECKSIGRLNIVVNGNNLHEVKSSYLSMYAIPKSLSKNGTIECKQIALPPGYLYKIKGVILMSIWGRGIIG